MGLLISDYIISVGNKEKNVGLNNSSISADRKSINNDDISHDIISNIDDMSLYVISNDDDLSHDATSNNDVISYNAKKLDADNAFDSSIPTQPDIPRIITNSAVVINKDDDFNDYNIIHQHRRKNNYDSHHHHDSKEEVLIHSMKSYQQHMLEGAILFATFEIVAYLLQIIVPEQFNLKFSFNQFLQIVEKDLNPTIPIDL